MRLIIASLMVSGCSFFDLPSQPVEPTPSPTPKPCPTPPPPPEPAPGLFNAPDVVPVSAPFTVTLCKPFEPNTILFIDNYKLGTFGHHRPTDCMIVIVPGLNTPGKRFLNVGDLFRPVVVFDAKTAKVEK